MMEFRVVPTFEAVPPGAPSAQLRVDHWDDFGWRTMFQARIILSDGTSADLGSVKVLRTGSDDSKQTQLASPFSRLRPEYCSLGQRLSYYETLAALDEEEPGVAAAFLDAMRDAAVYSEIREQFEKEEGFQTSLLREHTAFVALAEGRSALLGNELSTIPGELAFVYALPGSGAPLQFAFGNGKGLPDRIQAVIGYNGVGKTRLLASLGMVAAARHVDRLSGDTIEEYGAFVGEPPGISAVICVSYSAFDDFPLPLKRASSPSSQPTLGTSYTYCGLRKPTERPTAGLSKTLDQLTQSETGDDSLLKSISDIGREFEERREEAVGKLRSEQLEAIFAPVLREPSFGMQGALPAISATAREWRKAFSQFSTGHKVVLNILVHLCAKLEKRSLVLLDEPEMHLHPPLVAALLSSVQVALESNDSFAIVATHSPIVAQEIPSDQVMILRRVRSASVVDPPEIETFGEDISLLTSRIFNLDNSESDFRRVLLQLAEDHSIEEIEALFRRGLSSQARVTVLAEQAGRTRQS